MSRAAFEIARIVAILALLAAAALLATPPGRLPLALRGIRRMLARDGSAPPPPATPNVSKRRRLLAFLVVLAAIVLALMRGPLSTTARVVCSCG